MPAPPILSLRGVTKRFAGVEALSGVDLDFLAGEVHAVLGENGAGKSTLMHVIYGLITLDAGSITIDGMPASFRNPTDARRAGIGMVHQEFALVDALTVTENLALALGSPGNIRLERDQIAARARDLAHAVGLDVGRLDARVGDLAVGMRQRIEILKALGTNPRILILDEPTAVLTPGETAQLFRVLRELRAQGRTILFITHKLAEVAELADRVTVMRRGRIVTTATCTEITPGKLAELMVGPGSSAASTTRMPPADGVSALRIEDLFLENEAGAVAVDGISLDVRSGEVVGIAGVDGNGQSEIFQLLAGLLRPARGTIEAAGHRLTRHDPAERIGAGFGFIPPDRRREGAVLSMTVAENALLNVALLQRVGRGPFLDRKGGRAIAHDLVDRFAVRTAGLDAPAASLSGGNLQRLIIGRVLATRPRILVAFNPTRGLDVAATGAVHGALRTVLSEGAAVLLISTDLDEILELSDRVSVLYRGHLSEMYTRPFPLDRIARRMAGEE